MQFNTDYLNKTENKTSRSDPQDGGGTPVFGVFHETVSGKGAGPGGTLEYNLAASVQSSYNFLIDRDEAGTIYKYIDPNEYIAWHAGREFNHAASITVNGTTYQGFSINKYSIGIEAVGWNDGVPITAAQKESLVRLILYCHETWRIEVSRRFWFQHFEVAPGYKSDARGLNADAIIALAQSRLAGVELTFLAPPRMEQSAFVSILVSHNPTINSDIGTSLWRVCVDSGIDPAVALAFFKHESSFGTAGVAVKNLSWGNVHTPFDPKNALPDNGSGFASYASWKDSLVDWCGRIKHWYVEKWGLTTVEEAVHKYAPSSDHNNEQEYIQTIRDAVKEWSSQSPTYPAFVPGPIVGGNPSKFLCDLEMKQFYDSNNGFINYGYPLKSQFRGADASGEMCDFFECENAVLKRKSSLDPPYRLRPMALTEVFHLSFISTT